MRGGDVIVVKLGGSLAGSRHLAGWLDALAGCGGRAILVPGGGPFADAVRRTQAKLGFGDAAAHRMALLAMEQFGCALESLRPGFVMAGSLSAIYRALRDGGVPIWSPAAMVLRAADIPASWDVTSDSLAAWLAGRMRARRLLLVKHGAWPNGSAQAADLAARGVVDRAFPRLLKASGAQGMIVAPQAHAAAASAIRGGALLGVRIDLHERGARRLLCPPWPRSRRHAGVGP
jgi:5-(aminomethyl)-3-furanmethanol phosphate kinase